jgi:hypothetical protein
MSSYFHEMQKRHEHNLAAVRTLVGIAHEVRVRLHNTQVIFGSMVPIPAVDADAFSIRPWGRGSTMRIRFDDVSQAAPVRHMDWQKQRTIAAAQVAGIFTECASRHAQ